MTVSGGRERVESVRVKDLDEGQPVRVCSWAAIGGRCKCCSAAASFGHLTPRLAERAADHVPNAVPAKREPFEGQNKRLVVAFKRQPGKRRCWLGRSTRRGEAVESGGVAQFCKGFFEPVFIDVGGGEAVDVALAERAPTRVKARRRPDDARDADVVGQLPVECLLYFGGRCGFGHLEGDHLSDGMNARVCSAGESETFPISTCDEGLKQRSFDGALLGLALEPSESCAVVSEQGGETSSTGAAGGVGRGHGEVVSVAVRQGKKRGEAPFERAARSPTIFSRGTSEVLGRMRGLRVRSVQEPERGAA